MADIDRNRLLDLIAEWDELRDQGRIASPESLCPDDPVMQSALRERIAQRLQVEQMIEPMAASRDSLLRIVPLTDGSDTDERHDSSPPIPDRIGRYRVERLLGSGGFGLVFLAYDAELKRYVAVKVPHAELIQRPEQAETYRREAQSVANLDHPQIVPVYDVGSTEHFPCFVVSKYIPGTNLSAHVRQSHLSFSVASKLIATIADALHYAHTQGLVHRDVKPVNILMSSNGEPFLVDFGLALREQETGDGRRFAGTPAYMSPEQARGEAHRVDGRSDIFSLAVVLYELLVGRRPFQGATRSELLTQVTTAEPKPPRQIDDFIPKELERICLKALSKRASDRYTTARDFADDLRQFLVDTEKPTADEPPRAANARDDAAAIIDRSPKLSSSDRATTMGLDVEGLLSRKIVPRGLRSFDEHDADFFLQLLPGPRDREGLPESIRFWKTRIEERDPNKTFAIGMIYGPSGCGKSSLVKAGLLPRLSTEVISIYLEATATTTESRLLKGVRRRFPQLPDGLGLLATLTVLRQDRGIVGGGKVLLVIDQFEQWLHARQSQPEQSSSELIEALRQCDGEHLQCVVTVRDDFWMAATRFAFDMEIPLADGLSTKAVDLFPMRHAREVLIEFGRAFGCVSDSPSGIDPDQASFVDRALVDLAENGWVSPVRLVIFAEMLKEKPWTPATLKHVGGIKGVGMTFLEEAFGGTNAPALYRYHQRAAQAVLKTLLPEAGSDIKGRVRTYAELLDASGYQPSRKQGRDLAGRRESPHPTTKAAVPGPGRGDTTATTRERHDYSKPIVVAREESPHPTTEAAVLGPGRGDTTATTRERQDYSKPVVDARENRVSDFEDLMRILNRELRLVTLADPYGTTDDSASVSAAESEPESGSEPQCFQLTHDYLVPSLRDWLTWKQRETRRGRAELQLADRSALWNARPDNRLLPTLSEFVGIRLLTDPKAWTNAQRNMMTKAGRRHASRWGVLLAIVLIIGWGIQQQLSSRMRAQVKTSIEAMLNSSNESAPMAMRDLLPLPRKMVEQELRERAATIDEAQTLRLAYAQAELGDVDLDFLVSRIETASADEADNLIVALGHSRKKALEAIRVLVGKCEKTGNWLLKSRLALVAIYLGEADIASEMCQIEARPDPIQRTFFIESFCRWQGDVVKLVGFARTTNDVGLRSAFCLGLAGMTPERVTKAAKLAWNPLFTAWFQSASDSVTHSSAGLPLLFWGLEVLCVDSMTHESDARDWYINSVGMTLITVPPRRSVASVKSHDAMDDPSFLMSDREITMAQFGMFITDPEYATAEKPAEIPPFIRLNPLIPAHDINWYDAVLFCNWLSRKGGFTPCYERTGEKGSLGEEQFQLIEHANGYRLPLESQWEFACRAGTTTPFAFGDAWFLGRYANQAGPNLDACAIRFPNGWGFFDMHGNVAEWCNDSGAVPSQNMRRIRGGDWSFRPESAISSSVSEHFPYSRFERVGFRVARGLSKSVTERPNSR